MLYDALCVALSNDTLCSSNLCSILLASTCEPASLEKHPDLFLRFLNKHKVIVNLCSTALYCLHLPLLTKDIFVDLPIRQIFKQLLTGRVGDLRSRIINVVYIRFLLHCAFLFSNKSSTCFHCHIGCRRSVDSRRGRSSGPN